MVRLLSYRLLNLVGVYPVMILNILMNEDMLLNPQLIAMLVIVESESIRKSLAF